MSNRLRDLAAEARARKLPKHLQRIWREEGFRGVYVATSVSAVPRYPGDNALGRPVKVGVTSAYSDDLTRRILESCPYHDMGVVFRVWTLGKDWSTRLERAVKTRLRDRADAVRRGWAHMDATLDVQALEAEIFEIAKAEGVSAWNDAAVQRLAEDLLRHEMLQRAVG